MTHSLPSTQIARVDHGFDHFHLTNDGALTLHDRDRNTTHYLPLDEARLGDLTVARGYYRTSAGREYELRYPYGYDTSNTGPIRPTPTRGLVHGHHHSDWHGVTNTLRHHHEDDEGLGLLLLMTHAAVGEGSVLAATWAERAAVILRRKRRYADEVGLLTATLHEVPARHGDIIAARLERAKQLATQQSRTLDAAARRELSD